MLPPPVEGGVFRQGAPQGLAGTKGTGVDLFSSAMFISLKIKSHLSR
jgi:hypothetical protein